jgi:hypothetical protein
MAKQVEHNPPIAHEEIERRAHELYLKSGCIPGRDMDNWLEAERELTLSRQAAESAEEAPSPQPHCLPNPILLPDQQDHRNAPSRAARRHH